MSGSIDLLAQNRLLTEEVKRRVNQISAINMVAAAVGLSLDLSKTLETALQATVDVTGADAGGISLLDKEVGEVVLRAQLGWIQDFVSNPMRVPINQGMSGQVIQQNNIVVYNTLDGTESYAVPSFRDEHFRSIAMAPMHARGEIIGIISIMSHTPNRFDNDLQDVLRVVADTVGVAIDNAHLYETHVENERRLSAILQSTADGIIATDSNSRITMVNHTAETMLDIKSSEVIDMPLREIPVPARVRDQLLFALSSTAEERNKSFHVSLESGRVLSILVSPVFVESQVKQDKLKDGWLLVLQDVTHLHEAEVARAEFIQAAAHDMRNPLSVTQSSLVMLESMVESDDATVAEIFDIATQGIHRLQRMIDELFTLERIESGHDVNLQPVEIRGLCHEVSAEIKGLLKEKPMNYTQQIAPDVPSEVALDRAWISRAIHNYLENAVKYSPAGSDVQLHVYVQSPMLHIEVVDNGPGIALAAQSHVFDRFYRLDNDSAVKGTGLGLAIVKSIADLHGGSVYVQSKPGSGATFGIRLPLAQN